MLIPYISNQLHQNNGWQQGAMKKWSWRTSWPRLTGWSCMIIKVVAEAVVAMVVMQKNEYPMAVVVEDHFLQDCPDRDKRLN